MDNDDTLGDTSIASYERSEPSLGEKFRTFHSISFKNWYSIWVAAWVHGYKVKGLGGGGGGGWGE